MRGADERGRWEGRENEGRGEMVECNTFCFNDVVVSNLFAFNIYSQREININTYIKIEYKIYK